MVVPGCALRVTSGDGLIVIVYESGAPAQEVAGSGPLYGVTSTVATIGVFPVLTPVKEEISPVPVVLIPIVPSVFVQ